MATPRRHRVLPGFGLSLGLTISYLSLIVLIPLAAVFAKSAELDPAQFWHVVTTPRVVASYRLSFGAALLAAFINVVFGLPLAWALVRYDFPGKRIVDALVDLPFALPTAVAGIALTAVYAGNGWLGQYLEPLGITVAYTPLGVLVALIFIGVPFVVRTVQPCARGSRHRIRGGSGFFRRNADPNDPPRGTADADSGSFNRFCARLRTGGWRIRIGDLHRRQSADGVGDYAPHHHHKARAIRLCRSNRGRGCHARRFVRAVARHQRAAGVDDAFKR